VNVRTVGAETVVLDRRRRRIHQLNPTASFVWQRCDGRHAVGDIAALLVDGFDVDLATAEQDTTAMVRQLAQAGLLQDDPAHSLPTLAQEE
jgi:coenzyme PQQ synthesis protein D (PqqD)